MCNAQLSSGNLQSSPIYARLHTAPVALYGSTTLTLNPIIGVSLMEGLRVSPVRGLGFRA